MLSRPAHYNTRYKHDLTPKQVAVLDLMAKGKTNAEIDEALGLTLDGAKWHVSEILGKLGTDSREDAVAWWNAYRRPSARLARRVTAVMAWGVWKPAAIGAGGLGVVAVAGLGFLTLRGSGGNVPYEDLPGCEAEDMRWQTALEPGADATRLTLSIALREDDWYEGIFKTLHLSDREVESPCRLETTASVDIATLEPLSDWPGKGPAPVVPTARVETEPPGFVEVEVQARLASGPATPVLTVEVSNWCAPPGTYGANIRMADMFNPGSGQALTVELPQPPACTDVSRPPTLLVTAIDSP